MEIYLDREDGEKWACSDDKFIILSIECAVINI